jgi:FMN phosphatase YigB (HAD superfamily)
MLREYQARRQLAKYGVVFDFDGTLVDSYACRGLAHIEVAKILTNYENKQGYEVTKKAMVSILSEIEKGMTARLIYDRRIWFSEAVKRQSGTAIKIPQKILSEAALCYWNTIVKQSFLYSGAKELLFSLRKKTLLGLLSDTDGIKGMKLRRLHESKLDKFFDAIVISGEDTKETKPNKKPFIKICGLLGVSPTNCAYVGDNPNIDVAGAREIGMRTIVIENPSVGFENTPIKADYILDRESFSEVELLIYKLFRI